MTEASSTHISVELDFDHPVIGGRLSDEEGQVKFAGWLELVAALEGARARGVSRRCRPASELREGADTRRGRD